MNGRERAAAHLKAALRRIGEAREDLGFAQELCSVLTADENRRIVEILEAAASASSNIARALTSIEKPPAVNCPGCGGNGTALASQPKVLMCEGCGGYFTREPITRREALVLVNFEEWHPAPASQPADERYFDFTLIVEGGTKQSRVHGWFNIVSCRMTQSG